MTHQQIRALQTAAAAIIEACATPAPAGTLYAALMSQGCTLSQFEQITGGLIRAGMLTREGDIMTATAKGRDFAAKVPA